MEEANLLQYLLQHITQQVVNSENHFLRRIVCIEVIVTGRHV